MSKIMHFTMMLFFLSGCSITTSVKGMTQKNNEVFTGTATGYITGSGNFKLISNSGAICEGIYKYPEGLRLPGVGAFSCDDGTQGDSVSLTATGKVGTGYAYLNDDTYIQFVFGDVPNYSSLPWDRVKADYEYYSGMMAGYIYYCDKYPKTPNCAGYANSE